jgi:CheY-like chemotaxis protein
MDRNRPLVAVIEDNPADADMLRYALQQAGTPLEIVVLPDGSQALSYLRDNAPACNLVLLDLNLPILSGFDVLKSIKTNDTLKKLPVVVLSGSSNYEDIDRCYRAGANSYVCKPNQLSDILAMAVHLVTYWFDCAKLPVAEALK